MEGSASILLTGLDVHELDIAGSSWLGVVIHGCTICLIDEGLVGGTGTGISRGFAKDRRTSAVCVVTGETGPFSWFSSSRKLRVMDFFQCLGVDEDGTLVSDITRDRGSC